MSRNPFRRPANPRPAREHSEKLSIKGSGRESQGDLRNQLEQYRNQLDEFQGALNKNTILLVWSNFRESEGKKDDGFIKKDQFREVMLDTFDPAQLKWQREVAVSIFDLLFERFNYQKSSSIDIYDFLLSMSVCSRMSNEEKILLILKLIDVDEDRCLSIGEVFKMIYILEKNFVTEQNFLNFNSSKIYHEMSLNNALAKFKIIMTEKHSLDKINQKFLNQSLITYQEFFSILKKQPLVFKNFLPKNVDMRSYLVLRFNLSKPDTRTLFLL